MRSFGHAAEYCSQALLDELSQLWGLVRREGHERQRQLASCTGKTLASGEPCDVTSLSLSLSERSGRGTGDPAT